eukprot:4033403-Prymnesium_polylepis.1
MLRSMKAVDLASRRRSRSSLNQRFFGMRVASAAMECAHIEKACRCWLACRIAAAPILRAR